MPPSHLLRGLLIICLVLCVLSAPVVAEADDRWAAGVDTGVWGGTVNGTVFALAGNLDYYPVKYFSIGGLFLFAPGSDLTQAAAALVARYHYYTGWGAVVPFAGLGLIHADVSAGSLSRVDDSSTSHYVPMGVTVEYQMARKMALAATALFNLHALNLRQVAPAGDEVSAALLVGVRFGP